MNRADRKQWILAWLRERQALSSATWRVDVLDREFVDAYIEATEAKFQAQMIGANKCKLLSRDLHSLYVQDQLTRHTAGIGGGLCHQGFPRWVWSYALKRPS
jgi:hypothetical protein